MSRRRAKTSGWAAFDPKKHVADNETDNDPFPSISTNIATFHHHRNSSRNGDHTGKSFSSVLTYSPSFPNIIASEDPLMENTHSKQTTSKYVENVVHQIYEKLKVLHPWANDNLIEDIVAAVDNDIDKASTLLSDMAPPGRLEEKKEAEFVDNIEDGRLDSSKPLENKGLPVENSAKELIHDNVALRLMMDMSMVPVEPEWEDDDVYLVHRKEAIRAMRLASRHSKAATEAYLRRDHVAAHEFSQKAQQEWSNAEKLHANAAKEILAIRNCENDDWTLDLHGLHATEAVQVLLEHLLKLGKSDRQQQLSRSRLLEVITGKGNHSRGEAALPVAVKSFLSEKGCGFYMYYHYEARTGVITVQPKFRQKSAAAQSNTL
ncbi:putative SMR domain-containing protein [Tanacetum coccineum]|uniref:SMR domain-containing protein n=1 Tax=Tanacetum coccineum TaxID=301880 RepID=A0ABQ5G515_9ASTR